MPVHYKKGKLDMIHASIHNTNDNWKCHTWNKYYSSIHANNKSYDSDLPLSPLFYFICIFCIISLPCSISVLVISFATYLILIHKLYVLDYKLNLKLHCYLYFHSVEVFPLHRMYILSYKVKFYFIIVCIYMFCRSLEYHTST